MKVWQLECSDCRFKYGTLVLGSDVTEQGEMALLDSFAGALLGVDCGNCGASGEWGFELMSPVLDGVSRDLEKEV